MELNERNNSLLYWDNLHQEYNREDIRGIS